MRLVKRLFILLLASALPLAACGGEEELVECTAAEGTDYGFVVNSVQVPANAAQATQIGLDINDDDRVDNALGMLLGNIASQAQIDITEAVGAAVNAGDVILLVNVTTKDLSNATCSGVSVYLGTNPSVAPCDGPDDLVCGNHLDGATSFEVAPDSPRDTTLLGSIIGGGFSLGPNGEPGNFTIELNLIEGGEPIALNLINAIVQIGGVTETGLTSGVLAGAITRDDVDTSILPAAHQLINDVVAIDCTGAAPDCCTPDSAGAAILQFFDANDDCAIEFQELAESEVLASFLTPDLDLLDASGNVSPDGEKESLSLGLGFTAVKATFTP